MLLWLDEAGVALDVADQAIAVPTHPEKVALLDYLRTNRRMDDNNSGIYWYS